MESGQRIILRLESSEQKSTLHHPLRRKILEVLLSGVSDFRITIDTREEVLEDGTGITHQVSRKYPFQRYWMSVTEILELIKSKYPKTKITKHRCYYHLQKLSELGFVEQHPQISFDEAGNKQRTRGRLFRTTARFFVSCLRGISQQISTRYLETLKSCWNITPSKADEQRLMEIFLTLDNTIVGTMENLAVSLIQPPSENLEMPFVLEQLAWILLSKDDEFIALHQEARDILASSGGRPLGLHSTKPVLRHNNDEE